MPAVRAQNLPEAPLPAALDAALPSSVPAGSTPDRSWHPYINPGQAIHPLTAGEKLRFWLHLEVQPSGPMASFVAAGFEQGIDGDPQFGTDSGAFGERLGAAFIRDATMRFFVSSFFPAVLHEDPRYYRIAHGPIVHRGLLSAEEALLTHTDSGKITPNYSDLVGHLAATALTPLYYPAPSANRDVVFDAWATSIAGDAGNNLLLEFWPSIVSRWQRHRANVRARRASRTRPSPSVP